MDRKIERSISTSLSSIREASEEFQEPFLGKPDRIVVRKKLITMIQRCTALLAELDEDELQQEKDLQDQKEAAVLKKQKEARRRLEPPSTATRYIESDPDYKPHRTVIALVVLILFILISFYITHLLTPR